VHQTKVTGEKYAQQPPKEAVLINHGIIINIITVFHGALDPQTCRFFENFKEGGSQGSRCSKKELFVFQIFYPKKS